MKYLAIDIGNVICRMDFEKFLDQLAITLSITRNKAFDVLYRIQKLQDLGVLTISEEMALHYKTSDSAVKQAIELWNNTMMADPFVVSGLLELMSKGVKVALLSNMGMEHRSIIRHVISPAIYDNSVEFFSCDVGARKPSYLYYKTFLDMYPEFKGCVYIDDRPENIEASLKFGFEGCCFDLSSFKSNDDMEEMFNSLKILVLNS